MVVAGRHLTHFPKQAYHKGAKTPPLLVAGAMPCDMLACLGETQRHKMKKEALQQRYIERYRNDSTDIRNTHRNAIAMALLISGNTHRNATAMDLLISVNVDATQYNCCTEDYLPVQFLDSL